MPLPVQLRISTGSVNESPSPSLQIGEPENPQQQSFRARLSAKLKLVLEWMQERLFFFIR